MQSERVKVLPTRVGVDRIAKARMRRWRRSPHTRGGGPNDMTRQIQVAEFSPHAWGWTEARCVDVLAADVLPTRVGVDRTTTSLPPTR